MPLSVRTSLVSVDRGIHSCYKDKAGQFKPLASFDGGKMRPDAAAALLKLDQAVKAAGSPHVIWDCWRSFDVQKTARAKYDLWVNSGKPSVNKAEWEKWAANRKADGKDAVAFDSKTMKADYVSLPGFSNHEAGMAIDDGWTALAFPGLPADKQLDKLWEIAKPLGWSPIIKAPTEGQSECWHFDFWGEWAGVKSRLGYSVASMCAHLDIGIGVYGDDEDKLLQAQLQRIGIDVGAIDGMIGNKTKSGAAHVGIDADHPDWVKLFALPSSESVLWKP